jgi:hypothetical protein
MGYTRTTWQDFPETTTPITAASLNNLEGFLSGDASAAQWDSYTPTLKAGTTDPTLGTGATVQGFYSRVGRIVHGGVRIVFGSDMSAGSGAYGVTFPVPPRALNIPFGTAWLLDNSAGSSSTTTGVLLRATVNGEITMRIYYNGASVSHSTPWAWAQSDDIRLLFTYEAAA